MGAGTPSARRGHYSRSAACAASSGGCADGRPLRNRGHREVHEAAAHQPPVQRRRKGVRKVSRIEPITSRDGLAPAQQQAYDAVVASRGKVSGPFTVLLHRPELASAVEAMGGYLRDLSPPHAIVREAGVLSVAPPLHSRLP